MHLDQHTDGKIISTTLELFLPFSLYRHYWCQRLGGIFILFSFCIYPCEICPRLGESNWFAWIQQPPLWGQCLQKLKFVLGTMFSCCARLIEGTHFSSLEREGNFITDAHHDASPQSISSSSSSFSLDWHQVTAECYKMNILLCLRIFWLCWQISIQQN